MAAQPLDELLRLPPDERAALARALWDSLTDAERARNLSITPQQPGELGRPAQHHGGSPPLPWHQVRHLMQGGD